MLILNNYLEVLELKDNFMIDGILQKYDDNSPYIFARIIGGDEELIKEYTEKENKMSQPKHHTIILTRRISKIPVLNHYFVHKNDVIKLLTQSEYNELIRKEEIKYE